MSASIREKVKHHIRIREAINIGGGEVVSGDQVNLERLLSENQFKLDLPRDRSLSVSREKGEPLFMEDSLLRLNGVPVEHHLPKRLIREQLPAHLPDNNLNILKGLTQVAAPG